MTTDPKPAALAKAARFLLAAIRRAAPSERAALSFHIREEGSDVLIETTDPGATMTETGARRPLFGNRGYWTSTNKYHPGRTHYIEKAADRAAQKAAQTFADEWVGQLVSASEVWEEEK